LLSPVQQLLHLLHLYPVPQPNQQTIRDS